MLFVKPLLPEERETLENMKRHHPSPVPRERAQAVLLSAAGFNLKELSAIFGVCRQTAATWLNAWDNGGIAALLDKPRGGRPRKLSGESKDYALDKVAESPRSLKTVLAQLAERWQISVSLATLKRLFQQAGLVWKRVRKSLKAKRDPERFAQSQQQLAVLAAQAKQQQIDLVYFDEAGFTLEPCVPYAWQPIGKTIEVPSAKSKRLNVLGFMNKNGTFQSWVFEDSITTATVVACIDRFVLTLARPTALVIDNAPIHTSQEFKAHIERWQAQKLTILPIAPYSPELNLIEILWRKIKYEWMPFSAYDSLFISQAKPIRYSPPISAKVTASNS
ncbi:IS630 family transposase, partial [Methylocucumis oryzae]|uniref:IS630 family transposase n=1 Tax=Methylocucumis oryzae TaxID=1632867 RepID=UPI0006981498